MPRNPTTGGTKVAAVESAYAGRQQRCATPRCTNLASACCLVLQSHLNRECLKASLVMGLQVSGLMPASPP